MTTNGLANIQVLYMRENGAFTLVLEMASYSCSGNTGAVKSVNAVHVVIPELLLSRYC